MTDTRTISLDAIRADGWFDDLGADAPNFGELCRIVGERFVAFSVIAGVRITAITLDPHSPAGTIIEFGVGESPQTMRLALPEFQQRLAMTVVAEDSYPETLSDDASGEEIQRFIGVRYLLLSPLFGLRLLELEFDDDGTPFISAADTTPPSPEAASELGGPEPGMGLEGSVEIRMPLAELRGWIDDRVRAEASEAGAGAAPVSIDLDAIPQAEKATKEENWDAVVDLLGGWPGPLSVLLRTPDGQALDTDVRTTLAGALGLLGGAYLATDRHDFADEVLRLGVQWGQESAVAGDLFRRLGQSAMARQSHGQAIGLLRRALSLGAQGRTVLPLLAECFFERERYVAAAACLDEALAAGVAATLLDDLRERLAGVLGDHWDTFRELVPKPTSLDVTVRPPGLD